MSSRYERCGRCSKRAVALSSRRGHDGRPVWECQSCGDRLSRGTFPPKQHTRVIVPTQEGTPDE